MKMKYDGYYEKLLPYRITMEELLKVDYWTEDHILAYLRTVGSKNLLIRVKTYMSEGILNVFPGIALCSSNKIDYSICKFVEEDDPNYNPFLEVLDAFHGDHFISPYKIKFTSVEFNGVTESMYFSDFCTMVENGKITLIEVDQNFMIPEEID